MAWRDWPWPHILRQTTSLSTGIKTSSCFRPNDALLSSAESTDDMASPDRRLPVTSSDLRCDPHDRRNEFDILTHAVPDDEDNDGPRRPLVSRSHLQIHHPSRRIGSRQRRPVVHWPTVGTYGARSVRCRGQAGYAISSTLLQRVRSVVWSGVGSGCPAALVAVAVSSHADGPSVRPLVCGRAGLQAPRRARRQRCCINSVSSCSSGGGGGR